jgi:hypothetical protein
MCLAESGYIISEKQSSATPAETNSTSQSGFDTLCQDSPAPQLLKDQPLN